MGQRLLWASRSRGLLLSSASFVWLAAAAPSTVSAAYTFDTSEAAFDADYLKKPIAIDATIVDAAGQPLADATITVVGFGVGSSNNGRTTATSAAGSFTITGLTRRSALLKITRAGWYTEIVPVDLQRPADQAAVSLGRVRRNKSGTFKLTTRILDDGSTLSTIDRVTLSGGTDLDWRPFSVDLVAPSSATDLRLYFKQSPPGSGEGQVFLGQGQRRQGRRRAPDPEQLRLRALHRGDRLVARRLADPPRVQRTGARLAVPAARPRPSPMHPRARPLEPARRPERSRALRPR